MLTTRKETAIQRKLNLGPGIMTTKCVMKHLYDDLPHLFCSICVFCCRLRSEQFRTCWFTTELSTTLMSSSWWRDPPKALSPPLPGTSIQISTPTAYLLNISYIPLCVLVNVNMYLGCVTGSVVCFFAPLFCFHVRNFSVLHIFAVNY